MVIPEEKTEVIAKAYEEVEKVTKQYRNGIITDGERYKKVIDIWTQATDTHCQRALPQARVQRGQEEGSTRSS